MYKQHLLNQKNTGLY